ncbi:MAG: hypothetical protein AAF616_07910 [Bacteroidota bacterium]
MKLAFSLILVTQIFMVSCQDSTTVVPDDQQDATSKDSVNTNNGSQNPEIPDKWTDLSESEDYVARHECSFTQIGNRFILFGGREQARRLELYNYQNDTWTTGAQAPKQFNHFQATAHQGIVWVIGAFKTNNFPVEEPEENVWLYHQALDRWIKGPEIPEARRRGGAGLALYDNKFYVIGGNTRGHDGGYVAWFDEYDPYANTWTMLSDASEERDHFSAAVIGDKLYAAAGRKSGGPGGVFAPLPAPVDVYDFITKSWSTLAEDLPTPRAAPGTAVLQDRLYLMGGEGTQPGPAFKILEIYDPMTDSWTEGASMNHARHGTQAIVSGKGIFIAAGSPTRGGGRQHNMEVYGINEPEGTELIASTITTMLEVSIPEGETKEITISNEGGNTASFIESVIIVGGGFDLLEDYNFSLINPESSKKLNIENNSEQSGDSNLEITYNGGMVISVLLKDL